MEWAVVFSTVASVQSLSTMHCCKKNVEIPAYLCIKSSPAVETLLLFGKWLITSNSSI